MYDIIIIGAGPAGMTAALYAAQARKKVLLLEKEIHGGQIIKTDKVKILLSQHIGAPAKAVVKKGDVVKTGQLIAEAGTGLSVNIHASMDGIVTKVCDDFIIISEN